MDQINATVDEVKLAFAKRDSLLSWFYWIGGLSVINTLIAISGQNITFIFGLGITQVIDAITIGSKSGMPLGLMIGLFGLSFLVSGLFALFGYLGKKMMTWAIWMGAALYILDALILLYVQDFISLAFHGYVIFRLFQIIQVDNYLKKVKIPEEA